MSRIPVKAVKYVPCGRVEGLKNDKTTLLSLLIRDSRGVYGGLRTGSLYSVHPKLI